MFKVFRCSRRSRRSGVKDIWERQKGDQRGSPKNGQNSMWGKTRISLKLPNVNTHMTLMGNIAIKHVVSSYTRVCYVCVRSFSVVHVRTMLMGPVVRRRNTRRSAVWSRCPKPRAMQPHVAAVCIHTPLIWTQWHDEKETQRTHDSAPPAQQVPTEKNCRVQKTLCPTTHYQLWRRHPC